MFQRLTRNFGATVRRNAGEGEGTSGQSEAAAAAKADKAKRFRQNCEDDLAFFLATRQAPASEWQASERIFAQAA